MLGTIDRSVGQISASNGVKVSIKAYCLVYRYTCNSRDRIKVRIRVSFTTKALRSAILATAGLLAVHHIGTSSLPVHCKISKTVTDRYVYG